VKFVQNLKKYWNIIISFLLAITLIPFFADNWGKGIVILSVIFIWNILGYVLKDFLKSSFVILLLILPFNITYQLPYELLGFQLSDPFVDGIIVNYLIPTLSVVDLGVLLLLISMVFQKRIVLEWEGFSFLKTFLIFTTYLIIIGFLHSSFLSFFNSLRLLLYIFTFYNLLKIRKSIFTKQMLERFTLISIVSVIIQGIIAFNQFQGGTSLGLYPLGESKVVSGMIGSSFLELGDALYLRGYGTFPHPNILGGWLIFNLLFGWFLFDKLKKRKFLPIILMFLSTAVLVLTFSRISFLVCLIVWVGFIIKKFIKWKKVGHFSFVGLVSERVLNLFTGGDTSWNDRVGLFRSSVNIIKENILTGVGLGEFISNMGEGVPRNTRGVLILQPVHNIFLLTISEIGLLGFGLLTTLLYFFFKGREWSLRLVVGLLAIFIIGMFDHYLISLPQGLGILFFILII
jgi:O-antigen ligase